MTPISQDTDRKTTSPEDLLGEATGSLNIQLGRISAEIQSINSGFQAHMQQVLADTRAALERHYNARLDQCVDQLRKQIRLEAKNEVEQEFHHAAAKRAAHVACVKVEMERIDKELEAIGEEINKMLEDPEVELSKVMRKHTKQAELKAYLDGLRFALCDTPD